MYCGRRDSRTSFFLYSKKFKPVESITCPAYSFLIKPTLHVISSIPLYSSGAKTSSRLLQNSSSDSPKIRRSSKYSSHLTPRRGREAAQDCMSYLALKVWRRAFESHWHASSFIYAWSGDKYGIFLECFVDRRLMVSACKINFGEVFRFLISNAT